MAAAIELLPVFLLRAALVTLMLCVAVFAATGWTSVLYVPFAILYLWLICCNWKLAYWLLLLSIPFSMELGLLNHTLSTSVPDEPITWIFFLLLPLLLLFKPSFFPFPALLHPVAIVAGLQLVWVFVAVSYSQDVVLSAKYLLVKLWLFSVFFIFPFIIFKKKQDFITAFRVLLAAIVATIVIILIRHAQLGFAFMQTNKAIGKLYYNHVEYSTVISMFFPLACMAWPLTKGMRRWQRGGIIAILIVFGVAILFSYARAAILALAFALVVGVAIRYRFVKLIMPVFYAVIIGIVILLVHQNKYLDYRPNYNNTYMHDDFSAHLHATFSGTDMSGMERVYRWIAAVRMSRERPFTGYGPNMFVRNYKSYTVPAFRTYVSANTERSTTHNYFLYMLTEQGWPAMLLYAMLIMAVLGAAQDTYHRLNDLFYKRCTIGLAMMFSAAFINNFFSELTDTHKVGALFYLSMALIILLAHKSRVGDRQ